MFPQFQLQGSFTLDDLNARIRDNMGGFLEVEFIEMGDGYLKAKMPVNNKTRQPIGMLNGGASLAFAEITGSMASNLYLDRSKYVALGLDINGNHVRGVKEGWVYALATPLHMGKTTHVWEIRISNQEDQLVCISRLTLAVVEVKPIP